MNLIKIKYIVLVGILIFMGCEDNIDLTSPTMEVVQYLPTPSEDVICGTIEPTVFNLTGGDELAFDVVFNDDQALSQYKIDIHNNFDCHGHGLGGGAIDVVPNVNNETEDWTVLDIQDISGLSSVVSRVLDVPSNVTSGNYHFQIQVIDESGNDNPAANVFALKIKNPLDDVAPILNVTDPLESTFTIEKGQTISFAGQVTDERSLSDGGNGVLYLTYTRLESGNTFVTDQVFPFDQTIDKLYEFNFEYEVPLQLVNGDYLFSVGANDGVRNVAEQVVFEVTITN